MKKIFKLSIIALAIGSVVISTICAVNHSMEGARAATIIMLIAGTIGALYSLLKFSQQMTRKTDHPKNKRADGTPAHRLWPMWAFLGFFLIEVALAAACVYFAKNMWCVRDQLNFELMALLSAVVVYWFTHGLPGRKKA